MHAVEINETVLNSARRGLEYAARVEDALERGAVVVDFTRVERMTPSFANAFMMTLLKSHGRQSLRERLRIDASDPFVIAAINRAIDRYSKGIRLSTQREPETA